MPIDHSKCSHPRTPAGRRACRARHEGMTDSRDLSTTPMGVRLFKPRVSRETVRDRSGEVAPTRAMAELFGMTAPEPPAEIFLTTDAYIRNNGLIAPGQEWRPASGGSNRNKKREIKKATVDGGIDHDEAGNEINPAARSGLPVTTPGMYKHPSTGVMYKVVLGRESRRPFALTESGEYAKGVIFELRAADKVVEATPVHVVPAKLELGFYQLNGEIYNVKKSRSTGFLYAMHITDDAPKGVRAPGVVKQLTVEMKLTEQLAAQYGIRTGRCCICGKELTKQESIDRGIGPICYGRMGW